MTTSSTDTTVDPGSGRANSFQLDVERRGISAALRSYWTRIRSGEPGALPSVLGIVVLLIVFNQVSDRFLSRSNIGNLPGQGSYIAVIALGLVFVLLIGEIDLSAGTTGGIAAGFAAQAIFSGGLKHGTTGLLYWILLIAMAGAVALGLYLRTYTGPAVVLVGILIVLTGLDKHVITGLIFAVSIGAAVGIFIGWLVAKVGIPSFIVTLALFLAWQGVLLFALNSQPINVGRYSFWNGLANDRMSPLGSWLFVIITAGGYIAFTLIRAISAHAKGLSSDTVPLVLVRGGALLIVGVVIVIFANQNRNPNPGPVIEGLPWAATIPVGLMILCTIALTKTAWGRHLFATGGSNEAARRAGIDVTKIKVTAFTLCSSFGALGGIFLASNTGGVQLDLGSGNILLFSVAAAVIGGTSLFGGRGKARDAIIGGLVIAIIPNGIGLRPSLPAQYTSVITGAVLLLAAAVDALSRRQGSGRS
jgi:D-xylose transport system permease protein